MPDEVMAIPVMALTIPLVVIPTTLILRHRARRRELEHQERMRAFDLGLAPTIQTTWPSLAAIAIGAVVPVGSFFIAWFANLGGRDAPTAWICATIVGLTAVVQGSRLAAKLIDSPRDAAPQPPTSLAANKPRFDPDAFDVVSRRG